MENASERSCKTPTSITAFKKYIFVYLVEHFLDISTTRKKFVKGLNIFVIFFYY